MQETKIRNTAPGIFARGCSFSWGNKFARPGGSLPANLLLERLSRFLLRPRQSMKHHVRNAMADFWPGLYGHVHIAPIGVSESFDKGKDTVPAKVHVGLVSAINAPAKLTTDEQPTGFNLDGNLTLKRTDTSGEGNRAPFNGAAAKGTDGWSPPSCRRLVRPRHLIRLHDKRNQFVGIIVGYTQ